MKQGLDWYKREPRAFLDGVQGMGPELIGAYAVLLDLMYARGGDTMRDDRHLSGILGCSVRKARATTRKAGHCRLLANPCRARLFPRQTRR